ncbi:hypothetical protein BDU57DRAFT_521489 [Ampelomyces quisqualis]|uniref:Uncharacterized protein n=1 Tax=Ampelomyces quisqualis TaxID=50730 RepID=A0A6A5QBH9_AMPQU|nr:hypothetical protein BDU57DRAFT_521489 [Ampelomyces quisqualis]
MSSSYHIPFPTNFLAVNTPAKKADVVDAAAPQPEQFDHGFLSNRTVSRHSSVSSTTSIPEPAAVSAPPSPPIQAATSPVRTATAFAPLALNAKHAAPPLASLADMTPVARSAFLSNRGAGF